MSYSQAAEEARIIINLDFSLVVPGGTFYSLNEEKLPETVEPQEGAKLILDLTAPKPVKAGADFTDPVTRGVIRNYAAGVFIDHYGTDVKQETALSSRNALAIYGTKTSRSGVGYFIIVTERGIYEGRAVISARGAKERLHILQQVLASLTRYESTQAEIDAAKAQQEKAEKEEARRQRLEAEAAENARAAAARRQKAEAEAAAAQAEESAEAKPETGMETAEQEEQAEKKLPDGAEVPLPTDAGEAGQGETEPEEDKTGEMENLTKTPDVDSAEAEAAEKAEPADSGEGVDEVKDDQPDIEALEAKRRAHLDELRAKFAGNPQVEAGIDNYIARVDHTGDEVVAAFRKFLRGVQEYASTAAFTGEDDPNYVNMRKSIREEETNLGHKLDDLVRSVDVNMNGAVDAGVTEAYVERLIRMTERLGAKYDKLAVAMNGRDRMAYQMPAEISALILKWEKFRENLPSQLEETDRRRELETSNRLHREIQEKRAVLLDRQAAVEQAQAERDASAQTAEARQQEADTFEASYEERRSHTEQVRDEQLSANQEAVNALKEELENDRKEAEDLQEELSHTFALNMNRKKTLSAQIQEKNTKIADEEERLMQLQDSASNFESDAERQLGELEEQRNSYQAAAEEAKHQSEAAEQAWQEAAEAFRKLKEDLAAEEEEWKHVHENYLAGKYDDQPED